MKSHLLKLAHYNVWANKKFSKCLLSQEESILHTTVKSSFPTIYETCRHLWFGETGWLSRMEMLGWQTDSVTQFDGSMEQLLQAWIETSESYIALIKSTELEEKITFSHEEIVYNIPRADIILTIINHGNYHRGQIVTMLRELGITALPKTDYIEWVRELARNEL